MFLIDKKKVNIAVKDVFNAQDYLAKLNNAIGCNFCRGCFARLLMCRTVEAGASYCPFKSVAAFVLQVASSVEAELQLLLMHYISSSCMGHTHARVEMRVVSSPSSYFIHVRATGRRKDCSFYFISGARAAVCV